jgi:hypothetical protein
MRRGATARLAKVNVSTVANCNNNDDEHPVVDCVDDSIIPDAHSVAGSPLQLARTWRSRVLREQGDDAVYPRLIDSIYLLEGT